MALKKITFVAVVYNNYDDTYKFCQSLSTMTSGAYSMNCVLIDNSDDLNVKNNIKNLETAFSFLKVVDPGSNLGYFGAFNYFLQKVDFDPLGILVFCNNDLVFDTTFCSLLSEKKYPDKVLVVCPDVVTADGVHQNPHHLNRISVFERVRFDLYFSCYFVACLLLKIKRTINPFIKKRKISTQMLVESEINQGVGACYVMLPKFFECNSCLFFPWFLYGEEACLSWQVHSSRGCLWFDPSLKVWHAESATLSKLPRRTTYQFARNSYWGLRKYI